MLREGGEEGTAICTLIVHGRCGGNLHEDIGKECLPLYRHV